MGAPERSAAYNPNACTDRPCRNREVAISLARVTPPWPPRPCIRISIIASRADDLSPAASSVRACTRSDSATEIYLFQDNFRIGRFRPDRRVRRDQFSTNWILAELFGGIHHGQNIFGRHIIHYRVHGTDHESAARTEGLDHAAHLCADVVNATAG